MADTVISTTLTSEAATPVTVQAPAVVETTPVVQAVETPSVASIEAVAPIVEAPKPAETLLSENLTKTEPKPAETVPEKVEPKVEEAKVEETKVESQSEEPAPLPTYEPFVAPEGISLDEAQVGEFTKILADLEIKGKADHALVQEFGQKAVDMYVTEVKKSMETLTKFYQTTWERQKTEWKDNFLKDPEIGGNKFQTTVDHATSVVRNYAGTPEQLAEFRQVMDTSGLGNHPAVIRLLSNIGKVLAEAKPLAATAPVTQPKSKTATLYGKSA